ncbi:MAG: polysaccharide pyruvyl transferase family protein [Ruminococcus sp.]
MKLCITTWHQGNYGTCLQAYALYRYLEKQGHDVYMLNKVSGKAYVPLYKIYNPFAIAKRIISQKKFEKDFYEKNIRPMESVREKYSEQLSKKSTADKKFFDSYLKFVTINSKNDLQKFLQEFDCLISGSDQIWNPYCMSPVSLFNFCYSTNIRRISYASSLGVSQIPKNKQKLYATYLSEFSAISVREKNSKNVLQELVKCPIYEVVDPTFLLTAEDYNKVIDTADENLVPQKQKYILCYFVGDNEKYWDFAKNVAGKLNLKLITLPMTVSDYLCGENLLPEASVPDFLNLVKIAEIVITDSFHASVFSIIFEREFYVLPRFNDNDLASQNGRLYNLLELCNLGDRFLSLDGEFHREEKPDFKTAKDNIEKLRVESEKYLKNNISKN